MRRCGGARRGAPEKKALPLARTGRRRKGRRRQRAASHRDTHTPPTLKAGPWGPKPPCRGEGGRAGRTRGCARRGVPDGKGEPSDSISLPSRAPAFPFSSLSTPLTHPKSHLFLASSAQGHTTGGWLRLSQSGETWEGGIKGGKQQVSSFCLSRAQRKTGGKRPGTSPAPQPSFISHFRSPVCHSAATPRPPRPAPPPAPPTAGPPPSPPPRPRWAAAPSAL